MTRQNLIRSSEFVARPKLHVHTFIHPILVRESFYWSPTRSLRDRTVLTNIIHEVLKYLPIPLLAVSSRGNTKTVVQDSIDAIGVDDLRIAVDAAE